MEPVDPISWLQDKGALHDVFVESISLNVSRQTMAIIVEDIHANFAGAVGYRPAKCELIFHYCKAIWLDVEPTDGIAISDAKIVSVGDRYKFEAMLRYGAGSEFERRSSISIFFGKLTVVEMDAT